MYGRISDPGMTYHPPRVALHLGTPGWVLARSQWGWVFHTVLGDIDSGNHRFRPRFAGLVDVFSDFLSGDEVLSSPGGAGSTNPRLGFSKQPAKMSGDMSMSSCLCVKAVKANLHHV